MSTADEVDGSVAVVWSWRSLTALVVFSSVQLAEDTNGAVALSVVIAAVLSFAVVEVITAGGGSGLEMETVESEDTAAAVTPTPRSIPFSCFNCCKY